MPAYFVGEVDVRDHEAYAPYAAKAAAIIEKFGGKVLTKGGRTHALEGKEPAGRVVIIEFPDAATADALWQSPEYREIAAIRRTCADARAFVVEST